MLRRLQAGVSPARPDRRHIHHLVLAHSRNTRRAVETLVLVSFASGAVGVIGWMAGVPDALMFWALMTLFAAYHVKACAYWNRVDRENADAVTNGERTAAHAAHPSPTVLRGSTRMQRVVGAFGSVQRDLPTRGNADEPSRAEARRDVEDRAPH
jgi:hypothetical protein